MGVWRWKWVDVGGGHIDWRRTGIVLLFRVVAEIAMRRCLACGCLVGCIYVSFRIIRFVDFCIRWLEPWADPIAVDSDGSSPVRAPAPATPKSENRNVWDLFGPSIPPSAVSPETDVAGDGAGSFVSSGGRRR